MAIIIETKITAAMCSICGKVYRGEIALQQAEWCEKQPVSSFEFPLGMKFHKLQPSGRLTTYTVVKQIPGWYTHKPCYRVRTQSGFETVLNEKRVRAYFRTNT